MEFTPEQQAHIDSLISEKTKGLFSEEELNRRVTSEVDRRVESGIQKGLETQRSKWEKEFTEQAQMTAEELAQKQLQEQMSQIKTREQEISKRANLIDAKDLLVNANIPKTHYDKFINLLVSDSSETTIENVNNFIETFNETKVELESELKKQYANVTPPTGGSGGSAITKADFDKMTYLDKMKLKETNLELYKTFIK